MEWLALLYEIFEVCVIPLLGVLTMYIVKFIQKKTEELNFKNENELMDKYLTMLSDTIIDCVIATNQTYVESLKKQGKFDADAQKIAFTKTYTNVMAILNKDAKKYLEEAIGDLETYVYNKIEAEVKLTK